VRREANVFSEKLNLAVKAEKSSGLDTGMINLSFLYRYHMIEPSTASSDQTENYKLVFDANHAHIHG
jgi:hypothetical protein